MDDKELIENLKILLIYGKRLVDGKSKDGMEERIYKDEDDTAHYFYIREFLQSHFKDEEEIQAIKERHDVNSIFYTLQKLGHIVFAENTSTPKYKSGIFYMPKEISERQRKTLKKVQEKLIDEDYNIMLLMNLNRNENGITGSQRQGKGTLLGEITEEQER